MDTKHQRILTAIFETPVRANIAWSDVEALFVALGAEVTEGRGSRVRVALNGVRAVFHRPYPVKETDKGAIKSVRRFLLEAGVEKTMMNYKGYIGAVALDDEAGILFGEVINTRDVITFQGTCAADIKQAFIDSIEDYLEFCESRGEKPEKPFSGKLVLRMPPEMHQQATIRSREAGISLNEWVKKAIEKQLA